MKMRTIFAGVLTGCCLSAVSAVAADLPLRAAPPPYVAPAPIFTWTGFYIGGYAGGSFEGDVKLSTTGLAPLSFKRDGFTGGGLAGYNYQFSRVVVGVEGDAGYDGEKGSSSFVFPFGRTPISVGVQEKSDGFIGRGRGRIGFDAGNFLFGEALLYAAGGASYLHEDLTFTALGTNATLKKNRVGFNVGGGVEMAFSPHLIGRIEYIYDDFGSENYPALIPGFPLKAKLTDNTVRAAVAYKF